MCFQLIQLCTQSRAPSSPLLCWTSTLGTHLMCPPFSLMVQKSHLQTSWYYVTILTCTVVLWKRAHYGLSTVCLDSLLRSNTYSKECPPSASIANIDTIWPTSISFRRICKYICICSKVYKSIGSKYSSMADMVWLNDNTLARYTKYKLSARCWVWITIIL